MWITASVLLCFEFSVCSFWFKCSKMAKVAFHACVLVTSTCYTTILLSKQQPTNQPPPPLFKKVVHRYFLTIFARGGDKNLILNKRLRKSLFDDSSLIFLNVIIFIMKVTYWITNIFESIYIFEFVDLV